MPDSRYNSGLRSTCYNSRKILERVKCVRTKIVGTLLGSICIPGDFEIIEKWCNLYYTTHGMLWDMGWDAPIHLREFVEKEALIRFGDILNKDKNKILLAKEAFASLEEVIEEGKIKVRIVPRARADGASKAFLRSEIQNLTIDHLSMVKEDEWWKGKNLVLGSDIIQLEGWKRLIRHYGKYRSGLSIIVNSFSDYHWEEAPALSAQMNIRFDGKTSVMQGEYFVSKKGVKCFRVRNDGPHLLVRSDWGGAFNQSRGMLDAPGGSLYFRRARSNGGGTGYDYVIFPVGFRAQLREEDVI